MRTSLPEMRSDKLVNKTNGDKPRYFQLMVLMLLPTMTFTEPSTVDMLLPHSSFPFDQTKRMLRLNVQNIFYNLTFADL